MSSLVQAKCTNSEAASSSGRASNFDLIQYSTAFTSWFVVFSICLIATASASEKLVTRPSRYLRAPPVSGLNSAKPQSDRAMNHATSTCTRRCM